MKIILASKSKRRKKLLEKLNLKFTVVDSCFDESTIFVNHSNPEDYCLKQAYEKANLVYKGFCGFLDDKGEFLVIFSDFYEYLWSFLV